MKHLIQSVITWADERGIFEHSSPQAQTLKTVSEVGELCDNVLKGRDIRDDVGDVLVTLIILCHMKRTTLADCLALAYGEIKDRKGTMQAGGAFVKEGDECKSD